MLDNNIILEGLFTYVLFTRVVKNENDEIEYKFLTNSDGTCTAKSPMGLFPKMIDNDLNLVINNIKEYNEED